MKNKGRCQYRFNSNPLEKDFAEAWEELNSARPGQINGRGTLDHLLTETPNEADGVVTERDREVAATVIQWLGSPVGQSFLMQVQNLEIIRS